MYLEELTERIIGAAIEIHKVLGPGLLESVYESALCYEFSQAGISFERQKALPVMYKGQNLGQFRVDLVVADKVVVELKSVERHDPLFSAQILSYMKLGAYPVGLLINFNSLLLKDGIRRFVMTSEE
jgi:GxxExxY protein